MDSTLFPLAWMAYHIRRGLFRGPLSRAFYRASRRLAGERRGVEMVVDGEGTGVGGEPRRRRLTLTHDNAFALTALPMVATILELDGTPDRAGARGDGQRGERRDPRRARGLARRARSSRGADGGAGDLGTVAPRGPALTVVRTADVART